MGLSKITWRWQARAGKPQKECLDMFPKIHLRSNTGAVLTTLLAGGLATACGRGSPSANASAHDEASAIQSLGLPRVVNSTPILAASGRWVVAVWTAADHERA